MGTEPRKEWIMTCNEAQERCCGFLWPMSPRDEKHGKKIWSHIKRCDTCWNFYEKACRAFTFVPFAFVLL